MSDVTGQNGDSAASERARKKKALDPHLLVSDRGTMDDVRVQSCYPVWNLVGDWMTRGYDDQAIIADYGISREEWAADTSSFLNRIELF
jgi:hypothetical protein